jgi:hypothetical protein
MGLDRDVALLLERRTSEPRVDGSSSITRTVARCSLPSLAMSPISNIRPGGRDIGQLP